MKQQTVIKVPMNCDKCRRKAMKLAASAGFESIKIDGEDKDRLVVVGEFIDPVKLTCTLRKKIGYSVIVKVEEVKKDEKKKDEDNKLGEPKCYPCHPAPPFVVYDDPPSICSIL